MNAKAFARMRAKRQREAAIDSAATAILNAEQGVEPIEVVPKRPVWELELNAKIEIQRRKNHTEKME